MTRTHDELSWIACLSLAVTFVLVLAPRPSRADACAADFAQVRIEGGDWTTENPTAPAWNIAWDARPASSATDHVLGTGNATAWAWCTPGEVGGYVGESRIEFVDNFTLVGSGSDPVAWSSATPDLVDRDLGVAITAVPGVPFRVTVID